MELKEKYKKVNENQMLWDFLKKTNQEREFISWREINIYKQSNKGK